MRRRTVPVFASREAEQRHDSTIERAKIHVRIERVVIRNFREKLHSDHCEDEEEQTEQ